MYKRQGPGESATVDLSFATSETEHDLVFLADSGDTVAEGNEGDNRFATQIAGSAPAPSGPDIVIDDVRYWSSASTLYYEVEVTNQGDEPAGWFYVDVWVDEYNSPQIGDDGDAYSAVSNLAAGTTTTLTFTTRIPSCSPCGSWVLVDGYDTVVEVDEDNNTWGPLSVWP